VSDMTTNSTKSANETLAVVRQRRPCSLTRRVHGSEATDQILNEPSDIVCEAQVIYRWRRANCQTRPEEHLTPITGAKAWLCPEAAQGRRR
jgi:hypothetical protein